MHLTLTYRLKKYYFQLQFSDAPFFFDRDESLPETKEASHFVVDLLAKMRIHPSLPRDDCSLWKHGAEHCRTVCLARVSARMQDTTACWWSARKKSVFLGSTFWVFWTFSLIFPQENRFLVKFEKASRKTPTGDARKNVPGTPFFLQPPPWGNFGKSEK